MSEESVEEPSSQQVNLDESEQTLQEQVLSYYHSDSFFHTSVGFWGKLFFEFIIVALPIAVAAIILGSVLAILNIDFVTYSWVIGSWFGLSTTIMAFSWCFTDE